MGKGKIILFGYFLAVFLFLLGTVFQIDVVIQISKPLIIPFILVYYFIKNESKIDFLFVSSLLIFFVGEMLYLIEPKEYYKIGLIFFALPYLILIYLIFRDNISLFKTKNKKNDFTYIFIFILLSVLLFSVLSFIEIGSLEQFLFYLFFGLQLVILGVLTSFVYYNRPNKAHFFLILAVATFIISDLFFVLNKEISELLVLKFVNTLSQMVSYYFIVMYFLLKSK